MSDERNKIKGHIYVISSPSYPENCYKIGRTSNTTNGLIREYSRSLGIVNVIYYRESNDTVYHENQIFQYLNAFEIANSYIKGEWQVPNSEYKEIINKALKIKTKLGYSRESLLYIHQLYPGRHIYNDHEQYEGSLELIIKTCMYVIRGRWITKDARLVREILNNTNSLYNPDTKDRLIKNLLLRYQASKKLKSTSHQIIDKIEEKQSNYLSSSIDWIKKLFSY